MSVIEKIRIGVLNDAEDIIKSIGNENLFDEDISAQDDFDKALQEQLDIEKARMEGDIVYQRGEQYVWARTKSGSKNQFSWHKVDKKKGVMKGTGYKGLHGKAALESLYKSVGIKTPDQSKIMIKRSPNGHWRMFYDGNDMGLTLNGDMFTEMELINDNVCYQNRRVVDNFQKCMDYMEFNSPDDVYFVQVIKRWKDNKDKPNADQWKAQGKMQGTYHSGAEYMSYYVIHSAQELENVKADIIRECTYNNARAYMSINSRSQKMTEDFVSKKLANTSRSANDPRVKFALPIAYGMAKSGPAWKNERFKVLLDIDTTRDSEVTINGKKVNVWDETRKRLNDYGIKVATEYETPSGGLHLILNNKNNRNLKPFYAGLKDFDGGRNLDKLATVHPSEDIKMVLYSNVDTEGY